MRYMICRAKRKYWKELPKEEWWVEGEVIHEPYGVVAQYYALDSRIKAVIDPETICWYTEMTDRNGNRIWENDIVSCEHTKFQEGDPAEQWPFTNTVKYMRNYVVEFINTGSNYGYRLRNKSIHFMLTGNVIYNHNVKVIGNVFDNPELLENEK